MTHGNTVALSDSENGRVDVGGSGLEGAERVGNGCGGRKSAPAPPRARRPELTASRVVVEVALDVAADDAPQGADEVVNLPRVGASDGVGDTDAVHADLVDGAVDAEEVDEVGPERVLGREADLDALRLDKLDDLDGGLDDVGNVLAVRVLAEEGRGADDDVDSVNTCTRARTESGQRSLASRVQRPALPARPGAESDERPYRSRQRSWRRPCGSGCG